MINLNDKANGEQTMNDTRINTSEEQPVKVLIWLGEKIRRLTENGYGVSELAVIIQDAVQEATDHLKDKDGNPTMTVKSLPSTATEKQVNALTQVRTLAQLKSTPTFWSELTDDQQDQFNDLITITMDFIVSGEDIWDDDDDENVDETTEDPITTSEDGGTREVTSSATATKSCLHLGVI